jgi:uncharacterized DUF497 family protein
VTFEEAATVFDDELTLVQPDVVQSDRLVVLGMSAKARLLFVVYVEFETADVLRIHQRPPGDPS